MKRYLSIILSALMLTALMPSWAQAKPYEAYPWVYEDFEKDESINATASNASISRVEGGVADTLGAARITASRDYGTAKFPFQIKNGTTYKASAWVKMVGDIPQSNVFHFIFYMHQKLADGSPAENASCFKDISVSGVEYSQDSWTYVTTTFEYTGTGRLNGMDVETCDGDATVEIRLANGTLASTNGNPIDYLIDDLIVEPVMEEEGEEVKDTSIGIKNGNFELGFDEQTWSKQNCNVELIEGANGTNNGVKITSTGSYGQIKQRAPIEFNKAYRISLYAKAGDEATIGKEFKLIIDRKDGKTDGSITTNYEFLPASAIRSEPSNLILTDEWQKIEFIYKASKATFESNKPYIYPRVGSGTENECYCVDEIEVEEIGGIVYNGDFSEGLDGWVKYDADAQISQDVPNGDFENSVMVTETASQGALMQGVNLQQGRDYKISFYAKGVSWNDDSENLELHPVLDRYAENSTDADFYENLVLDDGTSAILTKDWQYYEFNYTCNVETDQYRVPLFYLKTGNGRKRTAYYMTGVEIIDVTKEDEPEPEEPKADISNLNIDGKTIEGYDLTFTYESSGIPNGLVKIMKSFNDRYVSVGSALLDGSAVLYTPRTEDCGSTIKFYAVAIDGDLNPSAKSVESSVVTYALDINAKFTSTLNAEEISGMVEINNNEEEHNVVAMLMLFDENNAMIEMDWKNVTSKVGAKDTINLVLPKDERAKSARIFVWEGNSAVDNEMISLIPNVSITK